VSGVEVRYIKKFAMSLTKPVKSQMLINTVNHRQIFSVSVSTEGQYFNHGRVTKWYTVVTIQKMNLKILEI